MNISDTLHTPNGSVPQVPTDRQASDSGGTANDRATETASDRYIPGDAPVASRADTTETGRESTRDERTRDEFVPTPVVSHNALYNVSDIRTDRNGEAIRTTRANPQQLRGQQVSDKIADIVLSMGRKSLSIFRLDT